MRSRSSFRALTSTTFQKRSMAAAVCLFFCSHERKFSEESSGGRDIFIMARREREIASLSENESDFAPKKDGMACMGAGRNDGTILLTRPPGSMKVSSLNHWILSLTPSCL